MVSKGVFDIRPIDYDGFLSSWSINRLRNKIPSFQYVYGYSEGYMVGEGYEGKLADLLPSLSETQLRSIIDQVLSALVVSGHTQSLFARNVGIRTLRAHFASCDQGRYFLVDKVAIILTNENEANELVNIVAGFISDMICSIHEKIGYEYWERLGFRDYDSWVLGGDLVREDSTFSFTGPHIVREKPSDHMNVEDCTLIELWK